MPSKPTKIEIDQTMGWEQEVTTTVYPRHFNVGDRVWLVYARDLFKGYQCYFGEVIIDGLRREKRLAGHNGTRWSHAYYYIVSGLKGQEILGKWWESEVRDYQVFATRDEALENMRGAMLKRLEDDRQRHVKNLATVEATIQQLKDTAIEIQYAGIDKRID